MRKILYLLFLISSFFVISFSVSADEQETLIQVWQDIRFGRWNVAEDSLNILSKSSSENIVCQAKFAQGNLWQFRQPGADMQKAEIAYLWIAEKYPKNEWASWGLLSYAKIPELKVLNPDYSTAVSRYYRVMSEYPNTNAAQEAVLQLALALLVSDKEKGAGQGVEELKKWLKEYPNPKYTAQIELLLGKLYRYPLGNYRESVNHSIKAFELGLLTLPQQVSTCWTIAIIAEKELKVRNLAIKYYNRFLKEFPRDQTVFMAKQGLKRLGAPVPKTEDLSLEGITKENEK